MASSSPYVLFLFGSVRHSSRQAAVGGTGGFFGSDTRVRACVKASQKGFAFRTARRFPGWRWPSKEKPIEASGLVLRRFIAVFRRFLLLDSGAGQGPGCQRVRVQARCSPGAGSPLPRARIALQMASPPGTLRQWMASAAGRSEPANNWLLMGNRFHPAPARGLVPPRGPNGFRGGTRRCFRRAKGGRSVSREAPSEPFFAGCLSHQRPTLRYHARALAGNAGAG